MQENPVIDEQAKTAYYRGKQAVFEATMLGEY